MKKRFIRKYNLTVTCYDEVDGEEEFWDGFQEGFNSIRHQHKDMVDDEKRIIQAIQTGVDFVYFHNPTLKLDVEVKGSEWRLEDTEE